jgi:hypothetical protein
MNLHVTFMMHSLLADQAWPYSFLATRQDELSMLIEQLKRWQFRFVKAHQVKATSGRVVCLAFDDGFLDNWTLLFPQLEREGIPFTIFVCRDFLEPDGSPRPAGLRKAGYLNRAELTELHASGLVDVQSHSTTHTWWPVAPRVVDLVDAAHPERHPWLSWNAKPLAKPFWMEQDVSYWHGRPVLENDRALRAWRWILNEDLWETFSVRVATERLSVEEANQLLREDPRLQGRRETSKEREARVLSEFRDNACFLRDLLGKSPEVLCWPGGAYDPQSLELAWREGYVSTASLGWGRDPRYLHRMSPLNPYGRDRFPWRHQRLTLAFYLARFAWRGWRQGVPPLPEIT